MYLSLISTNGFFFRFLFQISGRLLLVLINILHPPIVPKLLGARYGRLLPKIREALEKMNTAIAKKLMEDQYIEFDLGQVIVRTHDVRRLEGLDIPELTKGVDSIITSSPYGTAIDYIGDHVWALCVLDLTKNHLKLDEEIYIGTPRVSKSLVSEILEKSKDFLSLPSIAQKTLLQMARNEREQKAAAFYKYFVDMRDAFEQMAKILKTGKKLVMIIVKQQVMSTGKGSLTIELGQIMEEIGKAKPACLKHLSSIDIALQKASERGAIPTEHVIFFKKP